VKVLCFILSLVVVLLTVKPCCADNDCSLTEKQQTGNSKNNDCAGCSPFYACGSCTGFIAVKAYIIVTVPTAIKTSKPCFLYHQPNIKDVVLAIWQPPQLG